MCYVNYCFYQYHLRYSSVPCFPRTKETKKIKNGWYFPGVITTEFFSVNMFLVIGIQLPRAMIANLKIIEAINASVKFMNERVLIGQRVLKV